MSRVTHSEPGLPMSKRERKSTRNKKCSLLVEKQKDFSEQKRIDSQPENSLSVDGWCSTKH